MVVSLVNTMAVAKDEMMAGLEWTMVAPTAVKRVERLVGEVLSKVHCGVRSLKRQRIVGQFGTRHLKCVCAYTNAGIEEREWKGMM
jgi:hypothetical protein